LSLWLAAHYNSHPSSKAKREQNSAEVRHFGGLALIFSPPAVCPKWWHFSEAPIGFDGASGLLILKDIS
jgi:hypothetical protein